MSSWFHLCHLQLGACNPSSTFSGKRHSICKVQQPRMYFVSWLSCNIDLYIDKHFSFLASHFGV